MKKLISIVLSVALLFGLSVPAYAAESFSDNSSVYSKQIITITTKEERDAIHEKAMEEIMSEIIKNDSVARGPQYHYRSDFLPYEYKYLSGFAGNQLRDGYKFPTGGGFYYSDSGGPSVSGSFNVSLPKPYDVVSLSVNLGVKSDSGGQFVIAPSTTKFYKLYVTKKIEVRPHITYRARPGTDDWEFVSAGAVNIPVAAIPEAKEVK